MVYGFGGARARPTRGGLRQGRAFVQPAKAPTYLVKPELFAHGLGIRVWDLQEAHFEARLAAQWTDPAGRRNLGILSRI